MVSTGSLLFLHCTEPLLEKHGNSADIGNVDRAVTDNLRLSSPDAVLPVQGVVLCELFQERHLLLRRLPHRVVVADHLKGHL